MSPVAEQPPYLDSAWDEQVARLAVGLRLVDAMSGGRPVLDARVAFETVPTPHPIRRAGPRGADLGIGLPTMPTRRNGRFALLYPVRSTKPLRVRVFHDNRRFAPRRLEIPLLPEASQARRPGRVIGLHPGAMYELSGKTAIRSKVVKGHEDGEPVPWARVWATTFPAGGASRVEGVAHADDRGEFVLLLRSTNLLLSAQPTLDRRVVLHVSVPPADPPQSPGDIALDPLASLPIEALPAPDDQSPDTVSAGDVPPAGYTESPNTLTVQCRMGRVVLAPPFIVP